jgi:hypothetical protein
VGIVQDGKAERELIQWRIWKDQNGRTIWSAKHFYVFFIERRKQMLGKKAILGIVVVALVGLLLTSQTLSQAGQGGDRGDPAAGGSLILNGCAR